jgi:hypothetical protein
MIQNLFTLWYYCIAQYHKSNSALDLMIGELRLKMDGMHRESTHQKARVISGDSHIQRFHSDLQAAAQVTAEIASYCSTA